MDKKTKRKYIMNGNENAERVNVWKIKKQTKELTLLK